MTHQIKHKRISSKGTPFLAGSKKTMPIPQQAMNGETILVIANMPYFKKLMTPIFNTLGEARIHIAQGTLSITEMDSANVALIQYNITNHNGISIRNAAETFAINTKQLKDAIKDIKKDITVKISIKENKMQFATDNMKTEIPLVDTKDMKETKVPELKPLQKLKINGETLKENLKELAKHGESIKINTGTEGTIARSKGDKLSNNKITLNKEPTDVSHATYSTEYLLKLAPMLNKDTEAQLEWKTDYPLITTITAPHVKITYILAPRVNSDEQEEEEEKEAANQEEKEYEKMTIAEKNEHDMPRLIKEGKVIEVTEEDIKNERKKEIEQMTENELMQSLKNNYDDDTIRKEIIQEVRRRTKNKPREPMVYYKDPTKTDPWDNDENQPEPKKNEEEKIKAFLEKHSLKVGDIVKDKQKNIGEIKTIHPNNTAYVEYDDKTKKSKNIDTKNLIKTSRTQ